MLKKIRKATSLILTMVLALLVFTPASVHAVIPGEDTLPGSQNVIRSIRGNQASASLRQHLAEYDIPIADTSILAVVPSGVEEGTTALQITNKAGSITTTYYMLALEDNGAVQSVSNPNAGEASLCKVVGREERPYNNEGFRFVWAVRYMETTCSGRYCTQPQYAQFIYYNTGGHTVQSVRFEYITNGELYTYPGKQYLGNGKTTYEHIIEIAPSSPRANRYYTSTTADEFRTDQVIDTEPPLGGHKVEFYFTINNRSIWGDVALPNNLD